MCAYPRVHNNLRWTWQRHWDVDCTTQFQCKLWTWTQSFIYILYSVGLILFPSMDKNTFLPTFTIAILLITFMHTMLTNILTIMPLRSHFSITNCSEFLMTSFSIVLCVWIVWSSSECIWVCLTVLHWCLTCCIRKVSQPDDVRWNQTWPDAGRCVRWIRPFVTLLMYDRELLRVIHVLKEWRHYLLRSPHVVKVLTNHKNLTYFRQPQNLNRWQVRWLLDLSDFDLELHHVPGKDLAGPDALSHQPNHSPNGDTNNEHVTLLPQSLFIGLIDTSLAEKIAASSDSDPVVLTAEATLDNLGCWMTKPTRGKTHCWVNQQ